MLILSRPQASSIALPRGDWRVRHNALARQAHYRKRPKHATGRHFAAVTSHRGDFALGTLRRIYRDAGWRWPIFTNGDG